MISTPRLRLGAALLAGAATLAIAAPALAGSAEDGLWYYELYNFDDFHAQGIDGAGVTIAVIDSPIYGEFPTLKGADITSKQVACTVEAASPHAELPPAQSDDPRIASHGTNVTAIIAGTGTGFPDQIGVPGIAPAAAVLTYAASTTDLSQGDAIGPNCTQPDGDVGGTMPDAIVQAVDDGAQIISISGGEAGSPALVNALAYAYQHDVIVVVGLANQGSAEKARQLPPANLNGVVSVAAIDSNGDVPVNFEGNDTVNVDVDVVAPGIEMLTNGSFEEPWEQQELSNGASYATPFVSAVLALGIQKYPQATPNQLLQSLIHNTGLETHDPELDATGHFGYGIVDPITFLGADPTVYPDVNPFLEDEPRNPAVDPWGPTKDDVLGTAVATPSAKPTVTAAPSSEPTPNADADASDTPIAAIALVLGVVLIVGAGVTVAIVMSRRSKEASHGSE